MKRRIFTLMMIIGMIYNSNSQETIDLFIWAGESNAQGWKENAASFPADPGGLDSQLDLTRRI